MRCRSGIDALPAPSYLATPASCNFSPQCPTLNPAYGIDVLATTLEGGDTKWP